jgi:hypothetical protein
VVKPSKQSCEYVAVSGSDSDRPLCPPRQPSVVTLALPASSAVRCEFRKAKKKFQSHVFSRFAHTGSLRVDGVNEKQVLLNVCEYFSNVTKPICENI